MNPAPITSPGPGGADTVPIDLALHLSPASESHFFVDLSGDVSHAGLFVATYRDIAVGRVVALRCALDAGELVLRGVVAWQRDAGLESSPGVGVLLQLSAADRAAVARFCCQREPLYYEVDVAA